jgi:antitoxin component YwqK of YwqJK toxin-antitoxin module
MVKISISTGLIFLFIVNACSNKSSFVPLEKLKLVKTSRDSTYFMDQKPFSGVVKHIDDKGVIKESFFVLNGRLNGQYQKFYASGNLKLVCNYQLGILQGPWISYYENNQISESINYNNGYMQGQRKSFWINGLVKEENEFKRGILSGISNFYYSDGQLRKTIAFDFNGNRDGSWVDFYPNGIIKQKISYKSGEIIDSLARYNINGEIIPIK